MSKAASQKLHAACGFTRSMFHDRDRGEGQGGAWALLKYPAHPSPALILSTHLFHPYDASYQKFERQESEECRLSTRRKYQTIGQRTREKISGQCTGKHCSIREVPNLGTL